ncbi:MAG TPA: hypothetical protein VKA06_05910, partial [Spirochaetia bacterium]|nr:hypothetical protein [Spirochaetia bacterium]
MSETPDGLRADVARRAPDQALPVELPAPSDASLENNAELNEYLASVAAILRRTTGATLVGVYLVDPATGRLSIRAWADGERATAWDSGRIPGDLGRRGIDGDDLNAATLRDFMHAGPQDERIATPVHDGSSWVGAIIGLSDEPFGTAAPAVFHDAAGQLAAVLKQASLPIGDLRIEE